MPIYVYETVPPEDASDAEIAAFEPESFEMRQAMADEPLTEHPYSGLPVQRVITAPYLPWTWGDRANAERVSDKNLNRIGFGKYVKGDDGRYEKSAGAGPKILGED